MSLSAIRSWGSLEQRAGEGYHASRPQRLTCWSRIYPSPWPRWHPETDDPRGPAAVVEVPWHSASQTAFWGSLTRTRDYLLSNPEFLAASPPSPPALPVD